MKVAISFYPREHHPQERKRYEEDDQTVRDAVHSMDVRRDERRVRRFLRKVWTFSKGERDSVL
jgi:hypothetical protein